MLHLTIRGTEMWDEEKERFIPSKEHKLCLEHSLVSLSKWESKWCKPFITSSQRMTNEEFIDYIRCMTITQNVDPIVYKCLTQENIDAVKEYMDAPMTATTISKKNIKTGGHSGESTTNEVIYYQMTALNIPKECEKWHLNRLLTLIQVCSIKQQDPKKMSRRDVLNQNRALNAARRKRHNSRG